jgi:glycosyltransferase involved in cell wall biosynthesis
VSRTHRRLRRSLAKRVVRTFDDLNRKFGSKPPTPAEWTRKRLLNAPTRLQDGLSITGYLHSEIGLGQAARCLGEACDSKRIPVSFCNLPLPGLENEDGYKSKCNHAADRKTNMIVVGLPTILELRREILVGRRNILYPFWELSQVPNDCIEALGHFTEVWAPSAFVASSFGNASGVPVQILHQPVHLPACLPSPREARDRLIFLTYLDYASHGHRKNPRGAVEAFQAAFAPARKDVELVVKTRGLGDGGLRRWLASKAASDKRIRIIDRTLDRAGMDDLMAGADVFVSLHRSEGFGFGAAEALASGKAVIATDYGGTTDFINESTGYPVDYALVPVQPGEYVKVEGQMWADPRPDSAVAAMRAIYDDFAEAQRRTKRGFEVLQKQHALDVVGAELASMLRRLGSL